jgi:hypothetical protein
MGGRVGKECMMYIVRDLMYFADARTEEARAVRAAAMRLLDRIEEATGFSLDFGFRH